jgi:hypothetical protein
MVVDLPIQDCPDGSCLIREGLVSLRREIDDLQSCVDESRVGPAAKTMCIWATMTQRARQHFGLALRVLDNTDPPCNSAHALPPFQGTALPTV